MDNPAAVKHEGLARESAELRPPEEFAHLPFHFINRTHITVLDGMGMKPRIEPMMWNGHNWWTIASTRTETPEDAYADGWRYHAPCDPDAVILNPDDEARVEVGTMALAAKHGCVSDDRSGRIEVCKGNMIEGCSCRDEAVAVIRALTSFAMRDLPESSKSTFSAIGPKIETTNEPSGTAKQWELLSDGDYDFLERLAVHGGWLYRTGYGPRNIPPNTVCTVFVPDMLAPDREIATPPELLTRAKNQWADACIERDAAREEVVRLRATLRDTIAALDVTAIALDTAGDKLAASVAAAAIGNARKFLDGATPEPDDKDATIERLRAELAAGAVALELAVTYLHRTEYPGIAGRCAAAAKRAREGAEQ